MADLIKRIGGDTQELVVTTIFSFIGAHSCSDWFSHETEKDDRGFKKNRKGSRETGSNILKIINPETG